MNKLQANLMSDTTLSKKISLYTGRFKEWFYFFKNGHEILLKEESDIICETRFNERYKWLSDAEIQKLIKLKVRNMYKAKFPNAKRWSLNNL